MRNVYATVLLGAALIGAGCSRSDEPAAKQVGREAYRFKEQTKKAAKELGRDLRQAGKEAREGWQEEKSRSKSETDRRAPDR